MVAAEYVVVQVALPGAAPENIGVLLLDPAANRLYCRFRRDLSELVDNDDERELLEGLRNETAEMAGDEANDFLKRLEDFGSNALVMSGREAVSAEDFEAEATRLYRQHVSPKVIPFRTHLPRYSLRAAAGKFGEHMEVEAEGWDEMPDDLRPTDDMFVAHVTGRSMEPKIPDGSLCVFRHGVTGSRTGRLVLVENYGETGENRYTIKRYQRRGDRVFLQPLNPEFEEWELTEEAPIKVMAEFVRVLE